MDLMRRLLGGSREDEQTHTPPSPEEGQQVTVLLRLTDPELANEREQVRIYGLEDRLMKALDESGAGRHETNELESGFLRIQLVGPDAERMAEVVRPHLVDAPPGSYLALRRGSPGTSEERLDLKGEDQ